MITPRPELVDSVIQNESGGDPNAVSPKGATGAMQIMPATARGYGVDPNTLTDPAVNKALGTKILGDYIQHEGGNEKLGLIAYNEGPGNLDKGKVIPSAVAYADKVLAGANGPASVDQQYAARKQNEQDLATVNAYLAVHPEAAGAPATSAGGPTAAPQDTSKSWEGAQASGGWLQPPGTPTGRPSDALRGKQAAQATAADQAGQTVSNYETALKVAEPVSKALNVGTGATMLMMQGVPPMQAVAGGALLDKAQSLGAEATIDAARKLYGEGHPVADAIAGILGGTVTGAGMVGAVPSTMPGAAIEGAQSGSSAAELPAGGSAEPAVVAQAPIDSAAAAPITPESLGVGVPAAEQPTPPEGDAAATGIPTERAMVANAGATPETASMSLAQRQLDALKAVRVGERTATEFGRPDIATTVPESLTMDESKGLRQNLESYYAQGKETPKLAAHVQALASTYQEENEAIHALNADIRQRAASGENVDQDLQQLVNRFSAMAENYSTLAGTQSDVGRSLQILDPNKPGNAFVQATARIAQDLSIENSPQKLSDLLATLTPEQFARVGRQMAEDKSLGRSLYDAFNEYYVNNLLSNVGRTSSRIGISNAISTLMTLPTRQIQAMMPGSEVKMGEPLAGIQGLADGFWHAIDVATEALKTGGRTSQIEGGSVSPFIDDNKAISGASFGLEGTGIGTGIDYLGNVLRLPGRGLTAVHQFGHSMSTSMAGHMLAWRDAVNQASEQGLDGIEGYNKAQEIYQATLNDMPAEMRLNAAKEADVATFANQLEGLPADAQKVFQYPVLKQLMPFFKIAYNVKKMGADFTPGLGAITQASDLVYGTNTARTAAAAKVAMGAAFGVMISHEFHEGNLVLDKYGSPQAKFGDKLISIPEPLAFPIGTVGNYLQNRDAMDDPTALQKAGAAASALGTSLANDSIVQGLVNMKKLWVDIATGQPKALEQFVGAEASGLVPWSALLKGIAIGTDPLRRDPQTVGQEIQSGIPTTPLTDGSQALQPKYDIFAKPTPNPTLGLPQRLLYPVNVTKVSDDKTVNEITRLGIYPQQPPKFLSDAAAKQWVEDRAADGSLRQTLDAYVKSPMYAANTDQFNKSMLEQLISKYTHLANVKMLNDPVLAQKMMSHKMALKGMPADMLPNLSSAPHVVNEFSAAGPTSRVPGL